MVCWGSYRLLSWVAGVHTGFSIMTTMVVSAVWVAGGSCRLGGETILHVTPEWKYV